MLVAQTGILQDPGTPIAPNKLVGEYLAAGIISTCGWDYINQVGDITFNVLPKGTTDDQVQSILKAHDPTPVPPLDPVAVLKQQMVDAQAQIAALQAKVGA